MQSQKIGASLAKQINGGVIRSGAAGSLLPNNTTISLTSAGNVIGSSPLNIFEDEIQHHVKRYEVFEIEEDLLLLSIVWQRMRKERDNNQQGQIAMPSTVTDKILFRNITPEDRTRTETIRDYYHKKFMMWALNDIRLTSFREDLKKLIQSDGKVFKENIRPLAYRIPEFYDYDVMFDEMFIEHNTQVKQDRQKATSTKTFKLVKTMVRKRRHSTVKEFWFSDENDNLNLMAVSKDNPLLKLMEYHSQNTFKIQGLFEKKIRDNREYCIVEKYSFL